jgi:hypothetical protein
MNERDILIEIMAAVNAHSETIRKIAFVIEKIVKEQRRQNEVIQSILKDKL